MKFLIQAVLAFLSVSFVSNHATANQSHHLYSADSTLSNDVKKLICESVGQRLVKKEGPLGFGVFDDVSCPKEKQNTTSFTSNSKLNWVMRLTSKDNRFSISLEIPSSTNTGVIQAKVDLPLSSDETELNKAFESKRISSLVSLALLDQLPIQSLAYADLIGPTGDYGQKTTSSLNPDSLGLQYSLNPIFALYNQKQQLWSLSSATSSISPNDKHQTWLSNAKGPSHNLAKILSEIAFELKKLQPEAETVYVTSNNGPVSNSDKRTEKYWADIDTGYFSIPSFETAVTMGSFKAGVPSIFWFNPTFSIDLSQIPYKALVPSKNEDSQATKEELLFSEVIVGAGLWFPIASGDNHSFRLSSSIFWSQQELTASKKTKETSQFKELEESGQIQLEVEASHHWIPSFASKKAHLMSDAKIRFLFPYVEQYQTFSLSSALMYRHVFSKSGRSFSVGPKVKIDYRNINRHFPSASATESDTPIYRNFDFKPATGN